MLERFAAVFILTFLYGIQRQRAHKPVGFGTFILVAIGSCGLAIVAEDLGLSSTIGLLSAIIFGIGFLGAGALIRNSDRTFGFTTAASVWIFAIFGMTVGLGMYPVGGIIYVLVWSVILVDMHLEKKGIGSYRKEISVITNQIINKKEILEVLSKYCTSYKLIKLGVSNKTKKASMTYLIEGLKKDIEALLKEIHEKPWCSSVKIS